MFRIRTDSVGFFGGVWKGMHEFREVTVQKGCCTADNDGGAGRPVIRMIVWDGGGSYAMISIKVVKLPDSSSCEAVFRLTTLLCMQFARRTGLHG